MTQQEYDLVKDNIDKGIEQFINDKFVKALIPEKITKTLILILNFLDDSKDLLFVSGTIKKLNLLNIVSWFRFLKIARIFVINIINTWK